MKSQLMEERIRRITVLFSELSFRVIEDERSHSAYSATFEDDDGSRPESSSKGEAGSSSWRIP